MALHVEQRRLVRGLSAGGSELGAGGPAAPTEPGNTTQQCGATEGQQLQYLVQYLYTVAGARHPGGGCWCCVLGHESRGKMIYILVSIIAPGD